MRPKGTANELANRRRLAIQRVREGYTVAAVARFLNVSERSVYRWLARVRDRGDRAGLNPTPHLGPKPRLRIAQQVDVLDLLDGSPTAYGFATHLWTAPRVAEMIWRRFGVRYHPRYLNQWLTDRGVRPLKPRRQPREQNPAEVQRWLGQEWLPLQEQARQDHGWVVFMDEAGLLLEPLWRRSQAPRGRPAVVECPRVHRRKVSLLGALAWSPATGQFRLLHWSLVDGYFDSAAVATVLRDLLAELPGPVRVVWDRGTMHKGAAIREVKAAAGDRLQTLFLPAYTPEANPVEQLWTLLKYGRLCNFLARGVIHLALEAEQQLDAIKQDHNLLRSFFKGTILPLPTNLTLAA